MAKLCKDCEHFEILYEPLMSGGQCWDWGKAHCKKYDAYVDFINHNKFKWVSCIEEVEE